MGTLIVNQYLNKLWTPASISSSVLTQWADGADSSTIILNGSTISEWRDKSGNNNHWIQSDPTKQPSYDGSLNNVTVPRLDQNKFFLGPTVNYSEHLMLAVVRPGNVAENDFLGSNASTDGHAFCMFYNNRFRGHTWAGVHDRLDSNATVSVDTNYIAGQSQQYGTFAIYLNGIEKAIGGVTSTTQTQVHQNARPASQGTTDMAEAVLLLSGWTSSDKDKLEGYFAHKWGLTASLPVTHSYKNTPPYV